MYVDVPEFSRCCYCIPARYGLLIWTYIKLTLSVLMLIPLLTLMSIFYTNLLYAPVYLIIGGFTALGLVLDIIMNIVALVGAHNKKVILLHVYYNYSIFSLMLFIIVYMIIFITDLYSVGLLTVYHPFVWHYVVWYLVVGFASVVIQGYMLLLLRSKIHKLRSNCKFRFVNHAAEEEAKCSMHIDRSFVWNCPDEGSGSEGNKSEEDETNKHGTY